MKRWDRIGLCCRSDLWYLFRRSCPLQSNGTISTNQFYWQSYLEALIQSWKNWQCNVVEVFVLHVISPFFFKHGTSVFLCMMQVCIMLQCFRSTGTLKIKVASSVKRGKHPSGEGCSCPRQHQEFAHPVSYTQRVMCAQKFNVNYIIVIQGLLVEAARGCHVCNSSWYIIFLEWNS